MNESTVTAPSRFFVIDTEGHPLLTEVALIDDTGQLVYEACTPETQRPNTAPLVQPLADILTQVSHLTRGATLVAHHRQHEQTVLRASYQSLGLTSPPWRFRCTYELSHSCFPERTNNSLEALAQDLELGEVPFQSGQAHTAAYDARYTYYLYRRLQREQHRQRLQQTANPFSSTRVDTPFQSFADARDIYTMQYQKLKSVLQEIKTDPNQQSRGVVLLGESGSGKTHLMMRLAQDVIQQNRVLFIRQPTQAQSLVHHIYARILESLVQPADEEHTQLDLLLIRSLRTIFEDRPESDWTRRDREILTALRSESLGQLGTESTIVNRERWQRIEKLLLEWWAVHHSLAGFRGQILTGLMRFCRYSDPNRRAVLRRWLSTGEISEAEQVEYGLTAWGTDAHREEFALQAIQIFGKLSTLDRPLILVFDQLEGLWQSVNEPILLKFGEVLKELFTHVANSLIIVTLFPDRWQQFQHQFDGSITERVSQYSITLPRPTPEQLATIINARLAPLGLQAPETFAHSDLNLIFKQRSIRHGLNRANDYYAHRIKGEALPLPTAELSLKLVSRESELEQRVNLLERQVQSLIQLVKPLSHAPEHPAQPEAIAQTIESLGTVSLVTSERSGDAIDRYLGAQREALLLRFRQPQIIIDSDDLGKLQQICQGFRSLKSIHTNTLRLGKKKLPEHLVLKDARGKRFIGFLQSQTLQSVSFRVNNLNELVKLHPDITFILIRDLELGEIKSRVAAERLARFKNAGHGTRQTHFQYLRLNQRVEFELVFKLVTDIINRDLEIPMVEALSRLVERCPENWVVKLVARAENLAR